MSLPPSDPANEPERTSSWPPWRRTMLAGGIVLLANALAEALLEPDQPNAIKTLAYIAGYALLAIGFGLRMRNR